MNVRIIRLIALFALVLAVACGKKDDNKKDDDPKNDKQTDAQAKPDPEPEPKDLPPLGELAAAEGDQKGDVTWAASFGGLGKEGIRSTAISEAGEVAIAGYFEGEVDIAGTKHTSAGDADAFVVVYGADGKHKWTHTFGGEAGYVLRGVAFDPKGNVVASGHFAGIVNIGDTELTAGPADEVVVIKYGPTGEVVWVEGFGGQNTDGAEGCTTDKDGNIYVTGSFFQDLKVGETTLESVRSSDIFLIKLDPKGGVVWAKSFGGTGKNEGTRVAVDAQTNVLLLAHIRSEVSFGGDALKSAGNQDIALVKFNNTGRHVWSMNFGSEFNELGWGLAVDPAGSVAITGSFDNKIAFGDATSTSKGESDIYIAKFDSTGKYLWSHTYGSEREDVGFGVGMDKYGNITATGSFWQKVDFGGGVLTANGINKDIVLYKLSPNGDHVWSHNYGAQDHDQGRALAVNSAGQIAMTGLFRFTLKLGENSLESAREADDKAPPADVFVARFGR
jgi:hypothetical protein